MSTITEPVTQTQQAEPHKYSFQNAQIQELSELGDGLLRGQCIEQLAILEAEIRGLRGLLEFSSEANVPVPPKTTQKRIDACLDALTEARKRLSAQGARAAKAAIAKRNKEAGVDAEPKEAGVDAEPEASIDGSMQAPTLR